MISENIFEESATDCEQKLDINNSINSELPAKKPKIDKKTHKCPYTDCEVIFTRPYRLKNHISTHHEGQPAFKCDFEGCNKSYSNQSHLKRHTIMVHVGDLEQNNEVVCVEEGCRRILANKYSLKKHILRTHGKPHFQCQLCEEKFHKKNQLNIHKSEVHNESSALYECSKCNQTFAQQYLFKKHIARHKTYKCDCEATFHKWSEYLKHKSSSCPCPKTQHICVICKKVFTAKQNLTQHCLKLHLQDSQIDEFKCPYLDCKRSYKYKRNLTVHIKTSHEKIENLYKCTEKECGVIFKSCKGLKQHVRSEHKEKPLKLRAKRKPKKKSIQKSVTASKLSGFTLSSSQNVIDINSVSSIDFIIK
ncbi:hypothetical protein ABEB36_007777 [Hypothenemus hampei]|uniref:C2H2-type domain-containing protein n=1 Tax=Hypothenemus hampei TaxID=57062 RepID=A0ABD1EY71_HYPHA